MDTNPADRKLGLLELEGYVESQDLDEDGVPILTIHGIPCRVGSSTEIPGGVFRKVAMPMFDRDERRPKSRQTFLEGRLGIAGRLYYEFEERNNLDLDLSMGLFQFLEDSGSVVECVLKTETAAYEKAMMRCTKQPNERRN